VLTAALILLAVVDSEPDFSADVLESFFPSATAPLVPVKAV
jgi:hypothetical protein